jgi:processing peptidase subunit beta
VQLAHVAVAVETGGWTSPHSFPLMIMQQLLGSWDRTMGAGPHMSASVRDASLWVVWVFMYYHAEALQLCKTVGERNLAHSLTTFNTTYKDTGLFGVTTVSEPTTVRATLRLLLK